MNLAALLTSCAARHPDREVVVCGDRRVDFGTLERRSNALANALIGLGLSPGDRVALFMPNSVELVEAMAATLKTWGVIVPISTRLAAPEIAYILNDADPFAVFYTPALRETVDKALGENSGPVRIVGGKSGPGERTLESLIADAASTLPAIAAPAADDAVVCYTSGTTGRPKGAVSTHRNLVVGQGWLNAVEWRLSPSDRTLVATPMAHRTGVARIAAAFCLGSTMVLQKRFDPAETVRLIEAEAVTHIGVVPTIARLLLPEIERRPDSCATLHCMLATGEVFPDGLKRQLFDALPELGLHSFYSQTEAGLVSNVRPEEQREHGSSVGRPVAPVEVRLVDTALEDVTPGEPGEILVRCGAPGDVTVMREYFRRPRDTEEAFVGGWLRTGDMARMSEDGHLYFVDRLKDMIVSGGLNIYSREVEDALLTHPEVAEAAVIGVPDEKFGEAVAAFIVLKEKGASLDGEALAEHCRSFIAGYKKPRHVHIVDKLPRNAVGKVAKTALRNILTDQR